MKKVLVLQRRSRERREGKAERDGETERSKGKATESKGRNRGREIEREGGVRKRKKEKENERSVQLEGTQGLSCSRQKQRRRVQEECLSSFHSLPTSTFPPVLLFFLFPPFRHFPQVFYDALAFSRNP